MTRLEADRVLADWVATIDEGLDPGLRAVANALFLEDIFGIVLSDREIDPATIGEVDGMRAVLVRHGGTR
jgi:hypothetical protein